MPLDKIEIRGARQHNLKNIDLTLPRDRLVVITGLSGSGKSSLAFDTIYAEGQRRYVESLSSYARQFLGQMDKPDVEYISGLSPAISIDQKGASHNPRSTVGTVTEIYDYLRLLFARIGHPHCPKCHRPIQQQTSEQIIDAVLEMPEGSRIMLLAPLVEGRKGEFQSAFDDIRKAGFVRVRVDGEIRDLSDKIDLKKNIKHSIGRRSRHSSRGAFRSTHRTAPVRRAPASALASRSIPTWCWPTKTSPWRRARWQPGARLAGTATRTTSRSSSRSRSTTGFR